MGVAEGRGSIEHLLHYGMHVFDTNDQLLGTVLLVRRDHFVMRQELGINQVVALPNVSISGVIAGILFLTLTAGEIPLYGKVLERRERGSAGAGLRVRMASPLVLAEAT